MRLFCWFLLFLPLAGNTQVKIHSHNDYAQERPLYAALEAGAYSIEADVFYRNGNFYVAHSEKEIDTSRTLNNMYLYPLQLRAANKDSSFPAILLIDMKEPDSFALRRLHAILLQYSWRLNRFFHIVITGERGNPEDWPWFLSFSFDGRPSEHYSPESREKLLLISQSYKYYETNTGLNETLLKNDIRNAHAMGILFRLWGNPDDPVSWKRLKELGVDLINTDKPLQCRAFFGY